MGFVQKNEINLRFVQKQARQNDALLVAFGEMVDAVMLKGLELELCQQSLDIAFDGLTRNAQKIGGKSQIFSDRKGVIQLLFVAQKTKAPSDLHPIVVDVQTQNLDGAG